MQLGVACALLMLQEAGVLPLPAVPVMEHEYVPPVSAEPLPGAAPEPVNLISPVPLVTVLAGGTPTLSVLTVGAVNSTVGGKAPPQFTVEAGAEHCASAVEGAPTSAQIKIAGPANRSSAPAEARDTSQRRCEPLALKKPPKTPAVAENITPKWQYLWERSVAKTHTPPRTHSPGP